MFHFNCCRFFRQVRTINCKQFSTIYALSSGLNEKGSAVAVIRISGNETSKGLSKLISEKQFKSIVSNPRKAILTSLINPSTRELIDKGLVIWFPSPNSYTGEDSAELHVHGSKAIVSRLLRTLGSICDLKPAKEGEFTRRAFLNNKLNLIQAEGLSSLIAAKTDSQLKLAQQATEGHVERLYSTWRSNLLESISHLEAIINFAEDELIDENILNQVKSNVIQLEFKISQFLKESTRKSELIQGGINMAIIGLPNVGKSTLLNKLCRRDLSIVSPISGTTRDVVEGLLDIKGWSVRVSDTAGLKVTFVEDPIELEGIKRARQRAVKADLVLLVMDGSSLISDDGNGQNQSVSFSQYIQKFDDIISKDKPVIYVINKLDLLSENEISRLVETIGGENISMISCKTEQSFDRLIELIGDKLSSLCGNITSEEIFITERHQIHLQRITESLSGSLEYFDHDLALTAYYLRQCIDEIGNITGSINTEEILDVIFKDFCIGK